MEQRFISGRNNDFITETCKLKQKKYRNQTGLFYIEGVKLFKEVLNSDYIKKLKYIIAEESIADIVGAGIARPSIDEKITVVTVTKEVYKKLTDEEAFEGVMCVIEKPAEEIILSYKKPVIILCSVRDPGNVGTIIRTADAICNVDIILSDDCADIYSSKTQRAAMGAIFRQNIKVSKNIEKVLANLKENGYNIFAAHLDKNSIPVEKADFDSKTAVIFGNEGNGLSGNIVSLCDKKIIIPINQNSDSLNVSVAAAIIMWEISKSEK